jgi:hypothetical protein
LPVRHERARLQEERGGHGRTLSSLVISWSRR